jgi:hypothetical protein
MWGKRKWGKEVGGGRGWLFVSLSKCLTLCGGQILLDKKIMLVL